MLNFALSLIFSILKIQIILSEVVLYLCCIRAKILAPFFSFDEIYSDKVVNFKSNFRNYENLLLTQDLIWQIGIYIFYNQVQRMNCRSPASSKYPLFMRSNQEGASQSEWPVQKEVLKWMGLLGWLLATSGICMAIYYRVGFTL